MQSKKNLSREQQKNWWVERETVWNFIKLFLGKTQWFVWKCFITWTWTLSFWRRIWLGWKFVNGFWHFMFTWFDSMPWVRGERLSERYGLDSHCPSTIILWGMIPKIINRFSCSHILDGWKIKPHLVLRTPGEHWILFPAASQTIETIFSTPWGLTVSLGTTRFTVTQAYVLKYQYVC